jgi:hypothetical protein
VWRRSAAEFDLVTIEAVPGERFESRVPAFHCKKRDFFRAIETPKVGIELQAIDDLRLGVFNEKDVLWPEISVTVPYVVFPGSHFEQVRVRIDILRELLPQ